MGLSCSCDFNSDADWFYEDAEDYSIFPLTGRRKRCSCGQLIEHGSTGAKFNCTRLPASDIEERIHGDEVPMADKWLCERCADLYFSFFELGYKCISPGDNMLELLEDYKDEHPAD